MATLAKIEKYLGLHGVVDKKRRVFPDDEYLFPTRYTASRKPFRSSRDFMNAFVNLRTLYGHWETRSVLQTFSILSGVAVILTVVILLV